MWLTGGLNGSLGVSEYRLLHGDCLTLLPEQEAGSIDLIATDPPYPKLKGNLSYKNNGGVAKPENATKTIGDEWQANLDWVSEAWRVCRLGMIVFCSHHNLEMVKLSLPEGAETVGLASWYKRNSPPPKQNVPWYEVEYIWYFKKAPGLKWSNLRTHYDIPMLQAGCFASERILEKGTLQAAHPTQKPLELIMELLKCNPRSVCDPFMGTGTTGEAALTWGIDFVGIERNEKYFRLANSRIESFQKQPPLFTDPPALVRTYTQPELLP